jgi:molecular chaperone GrpE (heat shock protein)
MKENIIDLWIMQREIDKLKELLDKDRERLKAFVKASTTQDLVMLMDSYYEAEKRNAVTEVPDLVVYVIHELAAREDEELKEEEVPF